MALQHRRNTCQRKKGYKSEGAAEAAIRALIKRDEMGQTDAGHIDTLRPYYCPFYGGHWHVGHNPVLEKSRQHTEAA